MRYHSEVLNKNDDVLEAKNFTEDEDISSTLDSIKDAEHLMGYRGPIPTNNNQAWGAKPSDYNITGEAYNHDWWNYLVKDTGVNGMNQLHLTHEQLKDEGFYTDKWYEQFGLHDASGNQVYDSNGKPIADIEHYSGRNEHTEWQNKSDTLRVSNKREENKNWLPGKYHEYDHGNEDVVEELGADYFESKNGTITDKAPPKFKSKPKAKPFIPPELLDGTKDDESDKGGDEKSEKSGDDKSEKSDGEKSGDDKSEKAPIKTAGAGKHLMQKHMKSD